MKSYQVFEELKRNLRLQMDGMVLFTDFSYVKVVYKIEYLIW